MSVALQSSEIDPIKLTGSVNADREQWAHLLAVGTMNTMDGRGPYRADDLQAIIDRSFTATNTQTLPVDYNHSIDIAAPQGLPSPAAGWIASMQARKDGIWGLIRWTPAAAKAVSEKEYRFLSPVIRHDASGNVLAIARASLTNKPNLTLTALNAAQKDAFMNPDELLAKLRDALSLGTDATADDVLAAVAELTTSRNSADPTRFVPIGVFQQAVAEANKLRSGISLQAAEFQVDQDMKFGKILPFMKDWAISLCQANKAAYDDFLSGAGKPITDFVTSLQTVHDFSEARFKELSGSGQDVTNVHLALGHSPEDIKNYGGKA